MTQIPCRPAQGARPQRHGFGGVFQVVERLAPWIVLPATALGHTGLNQCPDSVTCIGRDLYKLIRIWAGTAGPGRGVVLGGCRFRETWIGGMLDGLIDPTRFELESAHSVMD